MGDDEFSFEGRVVIVTGASKGIGRGIAHDLAKRGVRLVVTGRKQERLDQLSAELDDLGAEFLAVARTVADHDGAFDLAAQALERWGRIDGLVTNAQSFRPAMPLADVQPSDMDLLLDTGPKATLWAMQAVQPAMRDAGWGRIVTMGSATGLTGAAGYGPYAASKEAIRALTRTAAREWGRDGIVVNCVLPASVGHRAQPEPGTQRAAVYAAMYDNHPLGRDGDAEDDIAPVVAFLLSDACRYLTGETFMVDGGGLMRA
jgi:NAD(P)-dependent dehydrogenase (short-subunit alcohol dehydrogenase family)